MGDARVLWLAVDEARGHLMRAHLARTVLAGSGVTVDIATTSERGRDFLAAVGSPCRVLRGAYHLAYDDAHNLQPRETARMLGRYVASRRGLLGDLHDLLRWTRSYDLVVNDSFHPALLWAGARRELRGRLVHVYGEHLPQSVQDAMRARFGPWGRALCAMFRRTCAGAYAHIEHTLDPTRVTQGRIFRLPPLIAAPSRDRDRVRDELGVPRPQALAVVYLNPRFADPALASAIVAALRRRRIHAYTVGESLPERSRSVARDARLTDVVAAADVLIAGAGMGALGHVAAFGVPFVALHTRQPEQALNLASLRRIGATHAVVDVNDRARLPRRLDGALEQTTGTRRAAPHPHFSPHRAQRAWADALTHLVYPTVHPTGAIP